MKKCVCILVVCLFLLVPKSPVHAQDPITMIVQQVVIKVIKAVDLKVQKLQTKTIALQNAQKALENTMSKLKLKEIQDWVQKQKDLYQKYFDELWKVKDILSYYHKIKEITQDEITLVKIYKQGYQAAQRDGHFSADEILYIGQIYSGMVEESLKNLDQIALVIKSFTTQMSDAARMKIIDAAASSMKQNLNDVKAFTSQNLQLSLARASDAGDIELVKKLYGVE